MGRFRNAGGAMADPASGQRSGDYDQSHVACHCVGGAFGGYKEAHDD